MAVAARRLAADGLVHGTSGNVSVRVEDRIAVTATGAVFAEMSPAQVTVVDRAGVTVAGDLKPTSELDLHLGAYDRFATGAVVHTHAPMATAVGCVVDEVPVVHYEMLLLGGALRVAPYRTFGTPELAAGVLHALDGRFAALMANHGVLVHGPDLATALRLTTLVEWACTVYWHAAQLGTPRVLDAAAQQAVFAHAARTQYGAPQAASDPNSDGATDGR